MNFRRKFIKGLLAFVATLVLFITLILSACIEGILTLPSALILDRWKWRITPFLEDKIERCADVFNDAIATKEVV